MFKRVEKRRRKKEEEEDLGLDEDMKDVLGMQDTDSDESNSDSDSDSDSGGSAAGEDVNADGEGEVDEGDGDVEEEDESEAENPEISVQDALDDPVYLISLDPDVKACIVCPGKLLKHPKMIEVHRTSGVCTLNLITQFSCESATEFRGLFIRLMDGGSHGSLNLREV